MIDCDSKIGFTVSEHYRCLRCVLYKGPTHKIKPGHTQTSCSKIQCFQFEIILSSNNGNKRKIF